MTAPLNPSILMTTETPISPDWVFSNSSNVSVAKDRGWFSSYTPFTSRLGSLVGNVDTAVVGIGSVEIPVKLRNRRRNGQTHSTIRLDEVLHAPTSLCNILGRDFMSQYDIDVRVGGAIKDSEGRSAGYFDEDKVLFCLKLSGPPVGPTTTPSLFLRANANSGRVMYINALWADAERARWRAVKPYTDAEKVWLKQNYKDEYHFLQQHGLSIYKDEDREDGRAMARSLMAADDEVAENSKGVSDESNDDDDDDDDEEEEEEEEEEEGDDADTFLAELEADPTSHVADYHFSEKQLIWIKKHYKHSGNFLLSHGLKPFDDEDCREGRAIVEAMM
ncbi:hypothetical protein OIDMADRAFT_142875 [Oidiodendron maius Zn]|uniref:Uncharacterized protein n=1 Tax=Oidiodendron maius (strain Zn) TaxID=913774 RepID=A0A0C3DST3_OIDMZ|nr:hypothetical protein OIDMADRAFT_142875 [Oidiodendron maius Zn]